MKTFLLVGALGLLAAEDPGHLVAAWGPIASGPAEGWQTFATGLVIGSGEDRLQGGYRVERGGHVDGQVIVGREDSQWESGGYFLPDLIVQRRIYARVGTDPIADQGGRPLVAIGGQMSSSWFYSIHGEIGWSEERGAFGVCEGSLPGIRVRLEADGDVTTARVGTGLRWVGTAAPFAAGLLYDWTTSTDHSGPGPRPDTHAPVIEGYVLARIANRVLVGIHAIQHEEVVDLATGALDEDVAQISVILGATF